METDHIEHRMETAAARERIIMMNGGSTGSGSGDGSGLPPYHKGGDYNTYNNSRMGHQRIGVVPHPNSPSPHGYGKGDGNPHDDPNTRYYGQRRNQTDPYNANVGGMQRDMMMPEQHQQYLHQHQQQQYHHQQQYPSYHHHQQQQYQHQQQHQVPVHTSIENSGISRPTHLEPTRATQNELVAQALVHTLMSDQLLGGGGGGGGPYTEPRQHNGYHNNNDEKNVGPSPNPNVDYSSVSRRAGMDGTIRSSGTPDYANTSLQRGNVGGNDGGNFGPSNGRDGGMQQMSNDKNSTGDAVRWQQQDNPEEMVKFSASEVKELVLDSLPKEVREKIPSRVWDRIFNDHDSVLSDDIVSLSKRGGQADVKDIVTYISGRLTSEIGDKNNESKGANLQDSFGQASAISDISGINDPLSPHSSKHSKSSKKKSANAEETLSNGSGSAGTGSKSSRNKSQQTSKKNKYSSSGGRARRGHRLPTSESSTGKVRFSHVDVRFYERVLADNPAVRAGPAIGLGWKYKRTLKSVGIDDWEDNRIAYRRNAEELILQRHERTSILFEAGYTQKDIADSIRVALRIKNQRKQTYSNLKYQPVEEFLEKTIRRVKRALTLGFIGNTKEQKMLREYKRQVLRGNGGAGGGFGLPR